MNGTRDRQRSDRLFGSCTGAELHARGRAAWRISTGAQPYHQHLEARLGLRLLTRTTRSVAPTEAGERLLQTVGPHVDEIETALANLSALREKPAGSLRLTSGEHATDTILAPALTELLPNYPDIKVEIINDYRLADIVAERYDAGVRLGEQVAKGMIAVRIGPDFRNAVVGAPPILRGRDRHARTI